MAERNNQPLNQPADASEFAKRRRVLRGLVSVPVILTLGNGAAEANVSSHQCLTNVTPGTEPGCQAGTNPPNADWDWQTVNTSAGDFQCVAYGVENTPGILDTVPYTVDQQGNPVAPGIGNPIITSCLTSFV